MRLAKVYRLTLGFDPITTIDVIKDNIIDAANDTVKYLQEQGNTIDSSIIISIELLTETIELLTETNELKEIEPDE